MNLGLLVVHLVVHLIVLSAKIEAAKRYLDQCEDIWRKPEHWWCDAQSSGLWKKNVDCIWMGTPTVTKWQDWSQASSTSRCAQSAPCSIEFSIEAEREVRNHFEINMNLGGELVGKLGSLNFGISTTQSRTITDRASRKQSMTCQVPPGYEASVWFGAEMLTFKGTIRAEEKQWDGAFYRPGSYKCYEDEGELVTPMKESDGQLKGIVECRSNPITNTEEIYFHKNDNNLPEGCEMDAANEALDKIVNQVPPMNQNVLTTGSRCGKTFYVRAMCFNIDNVHQYQALCGSCIRYARNNILSKGGKNPALGANWRIKDCYLRYEPYHFT